MAAGLVLAQKTVALIQFLARFLKACIEVKVTDCPSTGAGELLSRLKRKFLNCQSILWWLITPESQGILTFL
jgi:hypothetical protein